MHLYAIIPVVAGLSQDASYLFEALGCGLQSSHLGTEHCSAMLAMLNDFLKDVSQHSTTQQEYAGIKPPCWSFKRHLSGVRNGSGIYTHGAFASTFEVVLRPHSRLSRREHLTELLSGSFGLIVRQFIIS